MIRVGCIGTGGICAVHLGYLATRNDVRVAALCDIDEKNLESRRKEFAGEGFRDFNKMLENTELDAVWLCTPPDVRREPLLACAERGIPVLCEKPVERSLNKAEEIAETLRAAKAHVQIGYVFRCMPIVRQLREQMEDDEIHVVQSFYGCDISLTRDMPAWFYDKDLSGGGLIDQATHNLDLLRTLLGEVTEVQGLCSNPVHKKEDGYTVDEVIAVNLLFANGAVGAHTHTWVGDSWRNEILLSGQKRTYRLDLGRGLLNTEQGGEIRTFRQNHEAMYEYQNAAFIETVADSDLSRNPCDYDDGLATLKLTLACDRAVTDGGCCRLKDFT